MAKRNDARTRTGDDVAESSAPIPTTSTTLEQRIVAFAEQLGRITGTVQAKAEGWMDRDALSKQIASVRDSAAGLLEQLAGDSTVANEVAQATARAATKTRSRGVVDAPGKKHRKPPPADKRAKTVSSQKAKLRAAKTMVKSNRRRGRG